MSIAQALPRERAIRYIKGVGPQRLGQLAQLGIQTLEEACYYPPRRYEDRTRLVPIRDLVPGEVATVHGRILAKSLRRLRGGGTIFQAAVGDASGRINVTWFHQPYLAQQLKVGDEVVLYGRIESRPRPQLIHPEMERVEARPEEGSLHMGRIVPIYPLAGGMNQRWFRQVIAAVLSEASDALEDPLPESLRRERNWPNLPEAIRQLHFPSSWEALHSAQERLSFEELFLFQLALAQRYRHAAVKAKPQCYRIDGPLVEGLRARLAFKLTGSQERVLQELFSDLQRSGPMRRLLQGDVGCGKTIVIAFLIASAVQSGYQAALMAPTELLAEQHERVVGQLLSPLGVSVTLLSQGVRAAERSARAAAIAGGEADVAIGTHALIQQGVSFKRLSLVIIDEQHKFGVVQRARLARKASLPDVLVVTATPIPRTLALSVYGDLDVSTITELPLGRQAVKTLWWRTGERSKLYALMREELSQGRQGYVVYPLVEERSAKDLRAATQMAKHLQEEAFPEFRVGLLHGQMKSLRKEEAMRAFAQGEIRLLVSTVIVEVGLDVPNATFMVIEHPERFGLAQLHQLRGRIGRGAYPATCVVVSDALEEALQQRLAAFVETSDGFALAEKDLELRGPGELLGRQQHGWLRFRIAHLSRDRSLLESARAQAQRLVDEDPDLRNPSLLSLRRRLARYRQEPVS